ncbi:DUF1127 domain-containing protein [Marinimicrococcus flavescens]|uniref:DUF1127 domain-containing protein n=1 Tax=Marinimicrococcus flavescens TaxID=3031815 RepID=A0AAP4D5E8_9PROT|nr:DUF1127 domain-containing protein [Marinimicrococcus flavescens]
MAMTATLTARSELPRPFAFLAGLAASIVEGVNAHRRCQELYALDDARLADLGITREDIPRVAFFGASRR